MKNYYSFSLVDGYFFTLSGCSSTTEAETSSEKIQITPWLSTRLTLKTLSKKQSLPSKKNMVLRLT